MGSVWRELRQYFLRYRLATVPAGGHLTISTRTNRQLAKHPHIAQNPSISEIAFHEKAGRSQGNSGFMLFAKLFLPLPIRRCRHASIRTLEERIRFARCMLGVLNSAGAAICLAAEDFLQRFRGGPNSLLQLDPACFIQHAVAAVAISQIQSDSQSLRRNIPALPGGCGANLLHCRSPLTDLCFQARRYLGGVQHPVGDRPSHPIRFQELTAPCDTFETCTFILRACLVIGAELARLTETG